MRWVKSNGNQKSNLAAWTEIVRFKGIEVAHQCSACGKEIADAAAPCPHCGRPASGAAPRRGLPTWAKLLVFFLLPALALGAVVATKPTEAELRQAIRARAKELQAQGVVGPPVWIDVPHFAERFTYHDQFIASEIRFTSDGGKVVVVARGELGSITVNDQW